MTIEKIMRTENLKIKAYIEEEKGIIIFFVTELNEFNMMLEGKMIDGRKVMIKKIPLWAQ